MRRGLLLAATTLLVVSGVLLATRPSRALRDFRRAADELVARSESLRQRASSFDPDAALKALEPSRWNAEYYRLDENLASARVEAGSPEWRCRHPRSRPHSISTVGKQSPAEPWAIYTRTGVGLEYEVSVPRDAPMLRFGMSVLEDDPVVFSATVTDQGRTQAVYSNTVLKLDRWVDPGEEDAGRRAPELVESSEHVFVDAESFLEIKEVSKELATGLDLETTLSDYKPVEGLMMPHQLTSALQGNPMDTTIIESIVLNGPVDDVEFGKPKPGPKDGDP